MDILFVPVPLFNKDMAVEAHLLNYQKEIDSLDSNTPMDELDGSNSSLALEALNSVGIEAFTIDRPVFVPVNATMLLSDLGAQCAHPSNRIVFLLDIDAKPEEPYLSCVRSLRSQGFRIAFQGITDFQEHEAWLVLGDFIMIDVDKLSIEALEAQLRVLDRSFRNLSVIAAGVKTPDLFSKVSKYEIILFEGNFYRIPISRDNDKVTPLQMNLIRLLNQVRDESFEFSDIAKTLENDTALSVSLMRLINSPYIGLSNRIKNIQHAVTMLGQQEVRKWVTTSVARLLGADVPNEVTKLSLIRAKFCENLAPLFNLKQESRSVFMMGLFSVLDVILSVTMERAFEMVRVSSDIQQALVDGEGRYAPLIGFVFSHENADWIDVSQRMVTHGLQTEQVYEAYLDAISWYSDLVIGEVY